MNMNTLTMQTYVADHRAQLLAEARASRVAGRKHSLRRLLTRSRRPAPQADIKPAFTPVPVR
jgi:hypothetical protein